MTATCEMPEVEKMLRGLEEFMVEWQNHEAARATLYPDDVFSLRPNREAAASTIYESEGENVD